MLGKVRALGRGSSAPQPPGHRRPGSCHFSCLQGVQRYRSVIRRFDIGARLPARTWGCSTRKAFTGRRWSIKLSVCATVIAQSENTITCAMLVHGLTPASSSEFIKADGSEAEEDSSDILQCAFGFEQGLKHDPAVPWPSMWPWGTSTVGLPVQAPGSENANIWQYIANILAIYCSVYSTRNCSCVHTTPYATGKIVHASGKIVCAASTQLYV